MRGPHINHPNVPTYRAALSLIQNNQQHSRDHHRLNEANLFLILCSGNPSSPRWFFKYSNQTKYKNTFPCRFDCAPQCQIKIVIKQLIEILPI